MSILSMASVILTHGVNDNNIFHIFLWDIMRHYHPVLEEAIIYTYEDTLDTNNSCQKWRFFVWNLLCKRVNYISYLPSDYRHQTVTPIYDHMTKIKYNIHPKYLFIYNKISKNLSGKYILFNQRYNDNRTLYDDKTNNLLEDSFKKYWFAI